MTRFGQSSLEAAVAVGTIMLGTVIVPSRHVMVARISSIDLAAVQSVAYQCRLGDRVRALNSRESSRATARLATGNFLLGGQ